MSHCEDWLIDFTNLSDMVGITKRWKYWYW